MSVSGGLIMYTDVYNVVRREVFRLTPRPYFSFVQTRFLRRSGIAVENQRSEHHQSAGMLSVGRTVLLSNRVHAARRPQSVSSGTRRLDRSAVTAVRENPEVRRRVVTTCCSPNILRSTT